MIAEGYVVDPANESDCEFIGGAIRDAERAQTGTGIYDVISDKSIDIGRVLAHVALHDDTSCFHFSKFLVAREISTQKPVACACGFLYPTYSVTKSRVGINAALKQLYNWNDEQITTAWIKLDFLDDCFPDFEWNNSWMIEAVYTSPEHRGNGLAASVIEEQLNIGRKTESFKALITCAIGNDGAKRIYEKLGYQVVGQGTSEQCLAALGSPGFCLLCMYF